MKRIEKNWLIVGAVAALILLAVAACGGGATPAAELAAPATNTPAPVATDTAQPATATPEMATAEATATPPEPTEEATAAAEASSESAAEPAGEPDAAEQEEAAGAEMTVATLLAAFPAAPQAQGEALLLIGRVLDVNGGPVAGAAVEIWQTDASGVYDHPGDPNTAGRDQAFQFYGASIAGEDGSYLFRTILPGEYEPRPRHIHVKVRLDGAELLTTQFYFSEDRAQVAGERIFQTAGAAGNALLVQLVEAVDAAGRPTLVAANDIVVDLGVGAGELALTPGQAEGPYYPVVRVADYDNDLTITQ